MAEEVLTGAPDRALPGGSVAELEFKLTLFPHNHANQLHEAGNRADYDAGDGEPVSMEQVIAKFTEQQADHHRRGNDEGDFGVSGPSDGGTLEALAIALIISHKGSVSLQSTITP